MANWRAHFGVWIAIATSSGSGRLGVEYQPQCSAGAYLLTCPWTRHFVDLSLLICMTGIKDPVPPSSPGLIAVDNLMELYMKGVVAYTTQVTQQKQELI